MSVAVAIRALESDFNTRWAGTTPVSYTNTPFYSEGQAEWTRFLVNFTTIKQMDLGFNQQNQRQNGFIAVQFFVPLKQGTNRTMELVDKVVGLLSGVTVSNIRVGTPNINIVGETPQWFVSDVTFDFDFDFTRV